MPSPSAVAPLRRVLPDEAATRAFGTALAPRLSPGDTLALRGDLGAGKSVLARAIVQARLAATGLWEEVPSPTFTLVQTYLAGGVEIWHSDLYRLGLPEEADELGLADAFETAICLVEWPDRLGDDLPATALDLTLAQGRHADERILTLDWRAGDWAPRLAGIAGIAGLDGLAGPGGHAGLVGLAHAKDAQDATDG